MEQNTAVISETGMGSVPNGRNLMEQLLAEPDTDVRTLKYGDVLEGIVMQLDRDEVLVDIGSKSEGIIPNKELSSLGDAERKALSSGDTVLVFVVQPENAERSRLIEACDSCPVDALTVWDGSGRQIVPS